MASDVSNQIRKEMRKGGGSGEREEGRRKDKELNKIARGVFNAPKRRHHDTWVPAFTKL